MSQNNPNVNDILAVTTGKIGKYFHKSYLNLAKKEFHQKYGKKASLDDAQELRDMFEAQWVNYYSKYEAERLNDKYGRQFYSFCVPIRVDVDRAVQLFLDPDNIVEEQEQAKLYPFTYIVEKGLFEAFKEYATLNKVLLKHIYKRHDYYPDFSHLAYNGVTEDF